jgi:hypothetical protein
MTWTRVVKSGDESQRRRASLHSLVSNEIRRMSCQNLSATTFYCAGGGLLTHLLWNLIRRIGTERIVRTEMTDAVMTIVALDPSGRKWPDSARDE